MKSAIVLFFLLAMLLQIGILASCISYIRDDKPIAKETQFWLLSICSSILALLLFGLGTAFAKEEIKSNTVVFTFANLAHMAALLFQTYFCRSLNTQNSKRFFVAGIIFLGVFGIHFEYLRGSGQFVERVLEVAVLSCAILIWQCVELFKVIRREKSLQLTLLAFCTLIELVLVVSRVVVSATQVNPVKTMGEIPFMLIAILWFHIIFNTLSYLTLGGYWAERSSARRTTLKIENERISALLSERDKLISSLLLANKTSVAGALSASIAHELNQPIGATHINLFTLKELLAKDSVPKEKILEVVESIDTDTFRSSQIVSALRRLFGQANSSYAQVNVTQLVDDVVKLVKAECFSKNISLDISIDPQLIVAIGSIELHQVLLNLVTNAIHALENNGGAKKIIIEATQLNEEVRISVTDTGMGISSERVASLFELLSTDKSTGLGLGLWLSRYIVERYKGSIWYEDPATMGLGRGARFVITLPIAS